MNWGREKLVQKSFQENLSQEQKDIRRERYLDILQSTENDPQFLECVVTGDEPRVLEYELQTKHQCMEWYTSTSP